MSPAPRAQRRAADSARLLRALDATPLSLVNRESYRVRLAAWLRWCNARDLSPIAPRPRQLAAYVRGSGLGPATLRTALSALAAAHAALELPDPTRAPSVERALETAVATAAPQPGGRGAATLLAREEIMRIVGALPGTPRSNRNAALLLVAHETGLNSKRLAGLCWGDLPPSARTDRDLRLRVQRATGATPLSALSSTALSSTALELLDRIRPEGATPRAPMFTGAGHGFRSDANAPLSASQILRLLRDLCATAAPD